MELIKAKNYENASFKVANFVAAQVLLKPNSLLGLATGSTPEGMYAELVKRHKAGELSFAQVTTVNLDEYFGIPSDHEQSYYYYMHQHLLDHIDIDPANTHLPNGMAEDFIAEARRYDLVIERTGQIDIQLLGIGTNGHIGFNEPADTIPNDTHMVDLTQETIDANKRFFKREEDVPRKALTMGIGTILRAKKIVMMITGKNKAEALEKTLFGPICPQVPASLLRLHGDFTVIADEDALSRVQERM